MRGVEDTRYKRDQVGADDNVNQSISLPLLSTHPTFTAVVIDDAKDIATIDFAPRGNHRRSGPQLHRRAADSY